MIRVALVVLALAVRVAAADPTPAEQARAHFDKSTVAYNLGKFDEAIAELETAYRLDPDPAYLYSLAQAYRLANNRERALFFYRRYLAVAAPDEPNRADVEQRIATLEAEQIEADKAAADKAATDKAAAAQKAAAAKTAPAAPPPQHNLRLGISAGINKLFFGSDPSPPPQLSSRLLVAYIMRFRSFTVDLGGLWELTPIPYTLDGMSDNISYSQLIGLGMITYQLTHRFSVSAAGGLGVAAFAAITDKNPFTMTMSSSADLPQVCVRADLMVGIRLDDMVELELGPATWSFTPRNSHLATFVHHVYSFGTLFVGLHVKL
jgi:hypothetical protein